MVQDVRAVVEPVTKSVADMTPQEAQAELSKREADKMTRRAALAKIGMRAGLGVLAALSVDDLARMVARRMEQQAGQNAAVDKVARELRGAGLAFADGGPGTEPPCEPAPEGDGDSSDTPGCSKCKGKCQTCCDDLKTGTAACGQYTDPNDRLLCNQGVATKWTKCRTDNGCSCAC